MKQPHRNLFYYYRGPAPDGTENSYIFERQLEDNATKALIYVLEHSDRTAVLKPFLREIVQLDAKCEPSGIQFALQRVDIARPNVRRKLALAIAPSLALDDRKRDAKHSGRPDAWIWEEQEFAILIETKVVGAADKSQIYRHIDTARGWSRDDSRMLCISWTQIYRFFKSRTGHKLDPISKLLVEEFLEYLNMISVTNETTFEFEDFAFFALSAEDRSPMHKRAVSSKLTRFAEQLLKTKELRGIVALYGAKVRTNDDAFSPGTFRGTATNFWVTVGPKKRREDCHLTIRITEQGIRLDTFAPHRRFTKRLLGALRADAGGFLKSIAGIPKEESFCIRLREAYYSNPGSSYKGQRIDRISDYLEFHPSFLSRDNIERLLIEPVAKRLQMKTLRPEVFLVREFQLSEIIGRPRAVSVVAAAASKLTPYLRWALEATN